VERRDAPALSFSDTASLVLEIKVMGWIHRLSNPISVPLPINLMNNNHEINRFYNLIKKLPPTRLSEQSSIPQALSDPALRTRSAMSCKLERPENYRAASCSKPSQSSTAILRGRLIYRLHRLERYKQ
jgi:hypothetical protein